MQTDPLKRGADEGQGLRGILEALIAASIERRVLFATDT